uniref:Uncharacterized protein n=1 Tax=mine drainage metagenome TaxID=410659 RepID=E6QL62_9ZZZZ
MTPNTNQPDLAHSTDFQKKTRELAENADEQINILLTTHPHPLFYVQCIEATYAG